MTRLVINAFASLKTSEIYISAEGWVTPCCWTHGRMYKAWQELIVPTLPEHIEVIGVRSPVGSVYEYLEWNGDTSVSYRIYGGTEDIARLSNARMLQYFPKLTAINVAESEPESFTRDVVHAKGEWVRNSIQAGNLKEFKSYLPAFLQPHAKKYLDILVS